MLQVTRPSWASLVLLVLAWSSGPPAFGQEAIQAPSPQPAPLSSYGGFVPADLLLQQADARHPLTAEGWIVRDAPARSYVVPGSRYMYSDYLLRLRQNDSDIRLAKAEIASWQRRLSVYHYFNKAGALLVTVENSYLTLLHAEERLKNLQYERLMLMRDRHRHKLQTVEEVVLDER